MKILMFVPGGVGRGGRYAVIPALIALLRRLAKRHQVTVVALAQEPQSAEYELAGARICNLGMIAGVTGWSIVRRALRLRVVLARQRARADVVHAFWLGQTSSLALLAGRWLGAPVVASLGGGELVAVPEIGYGGGLSWSRRQHVKFALRAAGAVTAGSRYALEPLLSRRPDAAWLPLFPEGDSFRDLDPPGSTGQPRLLTVSSINRVKDPETLLRSLRLVVERFPSVQLDWVGEDTLGGEIQGLAAALGVAEHVHFHGFQTYDRLPEFCARARVYVQASRHESQGVAVCEAAAAGLPIVGTAVGLLAELAPSAAWAIPPGDPPALADGIVQVLSSQALASGLSRQARQWAGRHTADWTAESFEALYTGLVLPRTERSAAEQKANSGTLGWLRGLLS
ncbi:MAG: glycosyltransferase family 4 protein [Planctomycetota bacterium]|nr:glycosyltransferase family 4 protein [Planctomycetota bacterium]